MSILHISGNTPPARPTSHVWPRDTPAVGTLAMGLLCPQLGVADLLPPPWPRPTIPPLPQARTTQRQTRGRSRQGGDVCAASSPACGRRPHGGLGTPLTQPRPWPSHATQVSQTNDGTLVTWSSLTKHSSIWLQLLAEAQAPLPGKPELLLCSGQQGAVGRRVALCLSRSTDGEGVTTFSGPCGFSKLWENKPELGPTYSNISLCRQYSQ